MLEIMGKINFRLKLPKGSRVHPVFHISLLEKAPDKIPLTNQEEIKPINKEKEYIIKKILAYSRSGQQYKYLIK